MSGEVEDTQDLFALLEVVVSVLAGLAAAALTAA